MPRRCFRLSSESGSSEVRQDSNAAHERIGDYDSVAGDRALVSSCTLIKGVGQMGLFKGLLSIGSVLSPVPVIFRPTTTRERSRMYQRRQIRATHETNRILLEGNQPVAGGTPWVPQAVPLEQEPKSVIRAPQRPAATSPPVFRKPPQSRTDGVRKASDEGQDQATSALDGRLDLIVRLAALKDQGHLSQQEFDEQKSQILSQ